MNSSLNGPETTLTNRLFAVAVLLTCGLIMAMNQADPDLWGHVQYGRELLQNGVLPRTTTWSFAEKEFVWINHEILAEVALAWTEDHLGVWGLTLGKYAISLLVVGLVYWQARRHGVSPVTIGPMCLVMALAMEFHWHLRPQVFGYLFFALMLWILSAAFADWPQIVSGEKRSSSRLWNLLWLAPLMTLWANTHGSFPAGICVAAAALGLRGAELLLPALLRKAAPAGATASTVRNQLALLVGMGLLLLGATLVNPYGGEMYVWLWEALRVPCAEIEDWELLPLWTASRESLCAWIILGSTVFAVRQSKQRDWTQIIIFALVAWQSIMHIRHLPMLALVWGSWFAVPVDQWRRAIASNFSTGTESASPRPRRLGLIAASLCVWIAAVSFATWPKLAHLEVRTSEYPVDAFRYMAQHHLAGRTIVTFNWAQYAIGFFANAGLDSTVAFDGRYRTSYSQEILDRYFDFIFGTDYRGSRYRSPNSGPVDPTLALTLDNPELVVLSRLQKPSERTMHQQTHHWTLLYQDGLSQVWGRRDLFGEPASPRYIPPPERWISDTFPTGVVQYPAYPPRRDDRRQAGIGTSAEL
ncbi:hypothetical protein [Planctomicrobium piriforme]|nr:hypothetical protein [Planctomicrobium piriforme]